MTQTLKFSTGGQKERQRHSDSKDRGERKRHTIKPTKENTMKKRDRKKDRDSKDRGVVGGMRH